ncbi:hypothetical protein EJ110_NYTH28546 [Nymphaea thermarum]|nr:hypothetical protein EJ110_NYTH28546 [Nymphaea thermarum]
MRAEMEEKVRSGAEKRRKAGEMEAEVEEKEMGAEVESSGRRRPRARGQCVVRFGKKELIPRYCRPFEVLERIGEVAHQVALPSTYDRIHGIFHVSKLCKYIPDSSHVIQHDEDRRLDV